MRQGVARQDCVSLSAAMDFPKHSRPYLRAPSHLYEKSSLLCDALIAGFT